MQGRALLGPKSPDLPEFRVSTDFAFTKIGVDYAGPLYVKNIYGGGSTLFKAMILLFTCASTRNIHLELTPYMNAPALIRCIPHSDLSALSVVFHIPLSTLPHPETGGLCILPQLPNLCTQVSIVIRPLHPNL